MPDSYLGDAAPGEPSAGLADLTRRERECLALVAAGLESKEIAPLLGIEANSVDQVLKRASRRTGVPGRKRLARLMAERDPELCQVMYQRLVQAQKTVVSGPAGPPGGEADPVEAHTAPATTRWPVRTRERQWNDLTTWERRSWAAVIALGLAVLGALLLTLSRHTLMSLPTPPSGG